MVKFSKAFKDFLNNEANTCQGEASEDSICGFMNLGEWYSIWAKACEQFPDASYGDTEEDRAYALKVMYPCIS
jgi:hypothetical protein